MIYIVINGKDTQIASNTTIEQLLESLDLSNKRLAVEINHNIVSRNNFASIMLNEQDRVEIVQAIGGGCC